MNGFEPLAFRLGGGRSILLSYKGIFNLCSVFKGFLGFCVIRPFLISAVFSNWTLSFLPNCREMIPSAELRNFRILTQNFLGRKNEGERFTFRLGGGRSILLSYGRMYEIVVFEPYALLAKVEGFP